jgi:hypothetical protein
MSKNPKVLDQKSGDGWVAYRGDCVEVIRGIPDASVGYSVFSPPFASLYTYSNSDRDMGNCRTHDEFAEHFRFLVAELFRVLKPGRLVSVHCMLLPTSKVRDGVIGLDDFRGELIRLFIAHGFVFHSEVVIWKDPVTAMQRTKALGLLYKQIKKDSSMSRQGIPDYLLTFCRPGHAPAVVDIESSVPHYLVTMRKAGDNPEPIAHEEHEFPVALWQRYASPVWVLTGQAREDGFYDCEPDINPSDTLQHRSAREEKDEKHICPLQLEVIRRGVRLWSNPGDVVLTPFGGIGSEGYVALQERRKAVLVELKGSYFDQLTRNLAAAEPNAKNTQVSIFDSAALA